MSYSLLYQILDARPVLVPIIFPHWFVVGAFSKRMHRGSGSHGVGLGGVEQGSTFGTYGSYEDP